MKSRHKKGINNYLRWLERNKGASKRRRVQAFDAAIDLALLEAKKVTKATPQDNKLKKVS